MIAAFPARQGSLGGYAPKDMPGCSFAGTSSAVPSLQLQKSHHLYGILPWPFLNVFAATVAIDDVYLLRQTIRGIQLMMSRMLSSKRETSTHPPWCPS